MEKKGKNILVVTNSVHPSFNANSGIAYRISDVLIRNHDCHVTMLAVNPGVDAYEGQVHMGVAPVLVDDYCEVYHLKEISKNNLDFFISLAKQPRLLRFYIDKKLAVPLKKDEWEYPIQKCYERAIRRMLKEQKFDCIICLIQPVCIAKALANVRPDIPWIVYKLDPWTTNHIMCLYQTEAEMKREAYWEKQSDALCTKVLTTNLICEDMQKLGAPMEKYQSVEFPNILRPELQKTKEEFDSEHIHCVYTGGFYTEIRDAGYLFSAFEKLAGENILLHIFGPVDKGVPKRIPDNVIIHQTVPRNEAISYTLKADALVNVGNAVSNMLPSKLLEYISTGKPILNFMKIDDCPTKRYMEKYPLGFSIRETTEPNQKDVDAIREFILKSKGQRIPYEEIEQLYFEGTPAYLGQQIYSMIEEFSE